MIGSVSTILLITLLSCQYSLAKDPILDWINKNKSSTTPLPTLNASVSPFDEIQLRIDYDNTRIQREESVRIAFNPIDGLSNELKLSKQRLLISELEKNEIANNKKLHLYTLIVNHWRIKKSLEIIESSDFLFKKGQEQLSRINSNQNIDFDVTTFISNIANFNQIKMSLENQLKISEQSLLESQKDNLILIESINNLSLLPTRTIKNTLNELEDSTDSTEYEENVLKLKAFELTKKEKEYYQIFKFISYQRKEKLVLPDENTYQLAFRVPILSDNHEYEKAKLDFIMSKNKIETQKVKKKTEQSQLLVNLKSLIEKDAIYSMLPGKSLNRRKYTNSLENIDTILKSENTFLKAKLDSIQTKYEIFELYLLLLSRGEKFASDQINYISQKP